jgi:CBS domain-containing protein
MTGEEAAMNAVGAVPRTTKGRQALASVPVSEAMHRGVITCHPSTPLVEVAAIMARHRVHCLVVCENGCDGPDGWALLSDLDLIAAAGVRPADEQTAEGSAASPVVQVVPSDTLEHAAQLMTEYATSHHVVVDAETVRPVGVVSTLDIARAIAKRFAGRAP